MPEWLQILLWTSAAVTAFGVIWKVVQPIVRAAKAVTKAMPTLLGMAKEFQPNAGKSLADRVKRIDEGMGDITKEAARAKVEAEAAKWTAQKAADAAERTTDRLSQLAGTQYLIAQRLDAIEARSHLVRKTDPVQEMHVKADQVNIQPSTEEER